MVHVCVFEKEYNVVTIWWVVLKDVPPNISYMVN